LGDVAGIEEGGLRVFKGIPYAEPPVGDLRFAPPRKIGPWTSPLDASKFGSAAIQLASNISSIEQPMSEDCLTLNIWAPANSGKNAKLPVYVFIHGGGYAVGSGSEALFGGASFARQGIMAVNLNYRLNAMGFFASQTTFDRYGTTGNWGHLDQIMALEWIRDNIAAFGGDPDNVTIGGESAGSFSVSALILSPLARGLFHGAIMESGTILGAATSSYYAKCDLERSIEVGRMLSSVFHAKDDAEGLAELRRVDAGVLARLTEFSLDNTHLVPFFLIPVFDGKMMPKDPRKALRDGDFNKVRLLWGFNADEGSIFLPASTTESSYAVLATIAYGSDKARAVLERFPVDADNPAFQRARQLLGYTYFSVDMKAFGDAMAGQEVDVYAYLFAYVSPENAAAGIGASHGMVLPYFFDNLPIRGLEGPEHRALADEMHMRWVNFIKTGNPNQNAGQPAKTVWPKYDPQSPKVMRFDTPVTVEPLPHKEDMEFLKSLSY
jgi:para-nitrobenzyl esterase